MKCLPLLLAVSIFPSHAASIKSYLELDVLSEPQPVKAFIDDWDKDYESGDSAYTHDRYIIEADTPWGQVGIQTRYDYRLKFDPDTALYTYLEKNDLPFEDRDYRYQLDGQHATLFGVYFARAFSFEEKKITLTPSLHLYTGKHYQDAQVDGFIANDGDSGTLEVDYYFTKDRLFKTFDVDERPTGRGYGLDLKLDWQVMENWQLSLDIRDLIFRVRFTDSPFATGASTQSPLQVNDGLLNAFPTISLQTHLNGNERDHSLKLKPRFYLTNRYRINDTFSASLRVNRTIDDTFIIPSAIWHISDTWQTEIGFNTETSAPLVGVRHTNFWLELSADKTNIDDIRFLTMQLGFALSW